MAREIDNKRYLLNGLQLDNPRLYDTLQGICDSLNAINDKLFPLETTVAALSAPAPDPADMGDITITILPNIGIRVSWAAVADADLYEVRRGNTWETANTLVTTPGFQEVFDPLPAGTHYFWVAGKNADGVYGTPQYGECVISAPDAITTFYAQVIDNNVLLYWNAPTSTFTIAQYILKRNGNPIGVHTGTFATIFEQLGGTFTYSIAAVDIIGNIGSYVDLEVGVREPPDYELQQERTSIFDGTKDNALVVDGKLIVCVEDPETFQEHFVNNTWNTPEDQVNAGYPVYIAPGAASAWYQEDDFDYGEVYTNVLLSYDFVFQVLSGAVTVSFETWYKENIGDAWSGPYVGKQVYAESIRYHKVKVTFTGPGIMWFQSFRILMDVKISIESGYTDMSTASSEVVGGITRWYQEVALATEFKDVQSITGSVDSDEPRTVVVDFDDTKPYPDPITFRVYVFDYGGTSLHDGIIYWKARGVL